MNMVMEKGTPEEAPKAKPTKKAIRYTQAEAQAKQIGQTQHSTFKNPQDRSYKPKK